MQVLVLFEKQEAIDCISFFLGNHFGIEVHAAASLSQAISILSNEELKIEIVVGDLNDFSKQLISHALFIKMNICFLCNVPVPAPKSVLNHVSVRILICRNVLIIPALKSLVEEAFKKAEKVISLEEPFLCELKSNLLLLASPLKDNLYVKLSDDKYVRIMKKDDYFTAADLNSYVEKKKIEHFYIKRKSCLDFAIKILEKILPDPTVAMEKGTDQLLEWGSSPTKQQKKSSPEQVEVIDLKKRSETSTEPKNSPKNLRTPDETVEKNKANMLQERTNENTARKIEADRIATARDTQRKLDEANKIKEDEKIRLLLTKQLENELGPDLELIQEASRRFGFNKAVQDVTKKNVMMTVKTIKSTPKLSLLLAKFRREKEKYVTNHSFLLAYIGCALAVQMEWTSESTYQKIIFASFLHDIMLTNHVLATIQSSKELKDKEAQFSKEELEAYRDHPMVSAAIARHFTEIPPDVDVIIAQHHERPDGSGFPKNITHSRISPLSALFIVAHDLVSFMFERNSQDLVLDRETIDRFLVQNHKYLKFSAFKKVLEVLPKLMP